MSVSVSVSVPVSVCVSEPVPVSVSVSVSVSMSVSMSMSMFVCACTAVSEYICILQPVPWKMRLEMVKEMLIEILNDGETLVNLSKSIKIKFLGI